MPSAVLSSISIRDLPTWSRYAVATAIVALAGGAAALLGRHGVYAPSLLLLPGVMLVAAVLDRGTGLFAAALSGIVAYAFLQPGHIQPAQDGAPALVSFLLFLIAASIGAMLIEGLGHRAARAMKSERRKDLLLREASHRIKNNLQTITSLLRIQRRTLKSDEARGALEMALSRVHVMAAIHSRLAGSAPRETLEMSEFLMSLCGDLRRSMVGERDIAFEIDAYPAILDCARAAAVGFVINELVTNAVKYAFGDGRGGTIAVSFRAVGADFELDVADDGAGVPPDARPGLGQTLIQLFARQLEGTIEAVPGPGTRHLLRFPVAGAVPAT